MDPLATNLGSSPEFFPFAFEPTTDQVTLIRLSEADYRRASFLDARILNPLTVRWTVPWLQLEAASDLMRIEDVACRFKESVAHRAALFLHGPGLGAHVSDTDPHADGARILEAHSTVPGDAAK